MNNQVKYVVQGVLITLFVILIFWFISFFSSVRFTESDSSVIAYDNITQPNQKLNNDAMKGQNLFNANCASCHTIHKRLTGPALADFEKRGPWKDRKQLYAWVNNPEAYIKKNKYTKILFKEYQVMMTSFPALTKTDIDAIVDYINQRQVQYNLPVAIVQNKKDSNL